MNNRKEFKINASIDTSDFDKSIEVMQKKLRDLYAPADLVKNQAQTAGRAQQMGFGGMTAPTSQDFARATQAAKRENESLIREQIAGQEKLGKYMVEREKKLQNLKDHQNQMVKGVEEELKLKEKIARVEENLSRQRQMALGRDQALNQAMDAKNKAEGLGTFSGKSDGKGTGRSPLSYLEQMISPGKLFGSLGAAVGMGGQALGTFSNYYRDYGRMPIDTNMSLANAAQGSMGRDVSNIYGRRSSFEMPYMGERARAAQHALEVGRTSKNADYMDILSSMGKWGGAGMAAGGIMGAGVGGGLGALVGSVIPGAGTAVAGYAGGIMGGGIGSAIGGGIGGMAGILSAAGDPAKRALIMSKLPFVGKQYGEKYDAIQAERMSSAYSEDYEAQKNQNPFKKAAIGEYEQNYMRNLDAQRMMGMDNNQFYGDKGYMKSATNAGFTPEIALQMSQGIIGAGGSTRSASGNSVLGAEMSRGMGLTNASGILGSLSGSMGSAEATKNATLKILAEGVRLGLDDSKFAEENRRFTQSVAEVIARTGTSSDQDAQRIAGKFGSFVADNTNNGIAAAKSSYEEYQQMSTSTTGGKGVQRAAGFMSDPILGAMSTMDRQALMKVREDEVNVDNNYIKGLAQKYNKTPEEIVQAVGGVNKGAQNRYKEADVMTGRVQAAMKKAGISQLTKESFSQLPKEAQADVSTLQGYQMNEFGAKTTQEAQSRTYSTINGNPGGKPAAETYGPGDMLGTLMNKLKGRTGKIEDDTVASAAGDSAAILKNFNDMKPAMQSAAQSAAAFTIQIREMNAELMRALEASRDSKDPKAKDALTKILENMRTQGTQTQTGRGK